MLQITQEAFAILFGLSFNFDDLSRSQITLRAIFIHNLGAELLNIDADVTRKVPIEQITSPQSMLYYAILSLIDDIADTKRYDTHTYEEYPDFDGYTLREIVDMGEHIKALMANP